MSYSNVVGGKLKLKGKALDVRAGGMKKKKKRDTQEQLRLLTGREETGREVVNSPTRSSEADPVPQGENRDGEDEEGRERQQAVEDHRTPAEKPNWKPSVWSKWPARAIGREWKSSISI
jgi:hypothetical protein